MVSCIYVRVIHKILQIEDPIRDQHENMTMKGKKGGGKCKWRTKLFFSPKFALRDPVSVLDFHYSRLPFPTAPILHYIFFMVKHQQKISNTSFEGHLIYSRIFPRQRAKHFQKQNAHSSKHFNFFFSVIPIGYVNVLGNYIYGEKHS
jgi:hypothetical protein